MNKKFILTTAILMSLGIFGGVCNKIIKNDVFASSQNLISAAPVQVKSAPTVQKEVSKNQNTQIISTTSLNIVANPTKFLNKKVKMQATFDKFSTLGLDYEKALRASTDYIGILIQRDDVIDHNIPLSEMKLFLSKELAEKHIDLDTGDKIEIIAKEFSTALGDPWLDVEKITVIKKAKIAQETK